MNFTQTFYGKYNYQNPFLIKMFNNFAAEKLLKQQLQKSKQKRKIQIWNKRYKTEVRPVLVQRYSRRINGFAKKMEDQPVVVRLKQDGKNDEILLRDFDRSLNISKQNFMFKNSDDWKSIYTPLQRSQREQLIKKYSTDSNKMMALRNIWSQSKYNDAKVDYRPRDKQKDINPPMKYTNKNPQLILVNLPNIKNKFRRYKNKSEILPKRKISFQEKEEDPDIDLSLLNNSSIFKRNTTQNHVKTQKQLREEQQMKALAHKRLYFKSLIDLQQNVKTAKERNQLKQILVKCGIFKPMSGKVYEEEDVDRFLQMMKTKQL